jgi:hypothetical protein
MAINASAPRMSLSACSFLALLQARRLRSASSMWSERNRRGRDDGVRRLPSQVPTGRLGKRYKQAPG